MKQYNRDLWMLTQQDKHLSEQALAEKAEQLHALLYSIETPEAFCQANEVLDLNRYKVIQKPHLIQKVARYQQLPHFVFIFNKN